MSMTVFQPVNSVLSHVQCFMMQRVFSVESSRVRERCYPLEVVFSCSFCLCGDSFFTWVIVFAGREYLCAGRCLLCVYAIPRSTQKLEKKDKLYFTQLYWQNAWSLINFFQAVSLSKNVIGILSPSLNSLIWQYS